MRCIFFVFQSGSVIFYSLESQCVVGETKVPDDIFDLQICFDDSLDLLALLVSVLLLHDVNIYNSKKDIQYINDVNGSTYLCIYT